MNKKVIISLVLIAVMAFGAGLGTFAWFTSQATSGDNTFATGTLKVELNESDKAEVEFSNLYPGMPEIRKEYTIENAGTLPLDFRISSNYKDGKVGLFNILGLKVYVNGVEKYDGPLYGLKNIELGSLAEKATKNLVIKVNMPIYAGNEFNTSDMWTKANFVVDAKQTNSSNWGEGVAGDLTEKVDKVYITEYNGKWMIESYLKEGTRISDYNIKEIAITVYEGNRVLTRVTSAPKAIDVIEGTFTCTYGGDDYWKYGKWYGDGTEIPTKVIVDYIDNTGNIYSVGGGYR